MIGKTSSLSINAALSKNTAKVIAQSVLAICMAAPTWVSAGALQDADQARLEGRFAEAQSTLESMLSGNAAKEKQDAQAMGLLAYLSMANLDYTQANELLNQAKSLSEANGWTDVSAELANYTGLYHQRLGQYEAASAAYQNSARLAATAQLHEVKHQAMLNLVLLHEQFAATDKAAEQLARLTQSLTTNASVNAAHWLGAGKVAVNLGQSDALKLLQKGQSLADSNGDAYAQSIANGYLGNLYESAGKYADALALTDVAAQQAQHNDFANLNVQWEWQRGRIFAQQGDTKRSLAALRRAVLHVEASRQDIPVEYSGGRSSFRETLGPLYSDLARSLLDNAAKNSGEPQQALYREARQSVELIKRTELEDYFNNRCALNGVDDVALDNIGKHTASLYPIIFDDRLDLLVSVDGVISHLSTPVSRQTLTASAKNLSTNLRNIADIKGDAKQLYNWIIKPVKPVLDQAQVDTVVFVPDGVLRLVPLSVLSDGQEYVVEDYAVVTSPGLSVFDPSPTDSSTYSALLAGLSAPGDVVKDIPNEMLNSLLPDSGNYRALKTRLAGSPSTKLAGDLSGDALDEIRTQLEIEGVKSEMSRLASVLPSTTLLDDSFTKANLEKSLSTSPYKVVHIASHGVFGSSAENSFIMAHDKIITMNELESILYADKFKDSPIELITLSACQTAEGDDRAPLGLSGVALKAKVRSAVGSLWSISDEATVQFMESFYSNLMAGNTTKSEALRKAQLSFIKQGQFVHPYYWSPFVLIGNWL